MRYPLRARVRSFRSGFVGPERGFRIRCFPVVPGAMRLSRVRVQRGFPERSWQLPDRVSGGEVRVSVSGGLFSAGAVSGPHFYGVTDQIIGGSGKLSQPRVADGETIFDHGFSGVSDVFQLILIEHAEAGVASGIIAAMRLQVIAKESYEIGYSGGCVSDLQIVEEGWSECDNGFTGPAGFDGDGGAEGNYDIAPFHDAVGIDRFVCVVDANVGQFGGFFERCEQIAGHVCLVRVEPDDEEHVRIFAAGFFDDGSVVEEG